MAQWLTIERSAADRALLIRDSEVEGALPPALQAMVAQNKEGRVAVNEDDADGIRAWITAQRVVFPYEHGVTVTEGP